MTIKTVDSYEDGKVVDTTVSMELLSATHVVAYRVNGGQVYLQLMNNHCDEAVAFMSVDRATSLRDQLTAAIEEATK